MEFMKAYRDYRELLSDAENVTSSEEMIRLNRIRQTPEAVRTVLEKRAAEIAAEVRALEAEHDTIMDFLNGEVLME